MPYFKGTQHETRTCPRRHLVENTDVIDALALHRACDGQPGIDGLSLLTSQAVDAMAIIDDARAARLDERMKRGRDDDEQ